MSLVKRTSEFADVDHTDTPREFVDFLDVRAAFDGERNVRRLALDMLDVHEGDRVLDVGCGSGNAIMELAQCVGPTGAVVGLDRSEVMLAEARKRFSGVAAPIEFLHGDVYGMDFSPESFDRMRADRVFTHLKQPALALAEMIRVLKPDGRVVVCDFDVQTIYLDSAYQGVTSKIQKFSSKLLSQPSMGRMLPRLFWQQGLVDITCVPSIVRVDWEVAHKIIDDARRGPGVSLLLKLGKINLWLQEVIAAGEAGYFNAGITLFTVAGRKPHRKDG